MDFHLALTDYLPIPDACQLPFGIWYFVVTGKLCAGNQVKRGSPCGSRSFRYAGNGIVISESNRSQILANGTINYLSGGKGTVRSCGVSVPVYILHK